MLPQFSIGNFANPAVAAGDANGDGETNAGDQFVEVVNFGKNRTAGWMVRDAYGVRFRGCLASRAEREALAIFDDCGDVEGCVTANTDPERPYATAADARLGLDPAGGVLMVLRTDGTVADRVVYPTSAPNVSSARGAGGTCDARPEVPALQAHDMCVGAAGFSPGTEADGAPFVTPPPPPGDVCETATTLTVGVLTGENFVLYHNDFNSYQCSPFGFPYNFADLIFKVTVPGTGTTHLQIDFKPYEREFDAMLYLVPGCGELMNECLDAAEGAAGPRQVTYTNESGADQEIYLVIDTYVAEGTYDLTVALTAPAP